MLLNSRSTPGNGLPALIILHGLLGSTRNWQTVAKPLSEHFSVHTLDLRNHGESPWAPSMSYSEMAEDIIRWMDASHIEKAILMGHSLGGKVSMRVANDFPERLSRLIVVDIAPKAYPHAWLKEIKALMDLTPEQLSSRQSAEDALMSAIPDWALRKFLLTNLSRDEATGSLRRQSNLSVIYDSLPALFLSSIAEDTSIEVPSLFVIGAKSNYVTDDDRQTIARQFPNSSFVSIPNAGHNVHFDNPSAFVQSVVQWAITQ